MIVKEGTSLVIIFISTLIVSMIIIFPVYYFFNFEITLLTGLCLVVATIATIGVGIENTIVNDVHNQVVRLRGQMKGYLTDIYAEMIKNK